MASRTASAGNFAAGVLTVASLNNLPGGWIGYVEITADSNSWSTTATSITGLSVTVTVNSNRRIKITFHGQLDCSAEAEVSDIFLFEDTTAFRKDRFGGGNGLAQDQIHLEHILTPTSGSHTYFIKGDRVTGVNSHHIAASTSGGTGPGPAWLLVEDIGPAS